MEEKKSEEKAGNRAMNELRSVLARSIRLYGHSEVKRALEDQIHTVECEAIDELRGKILQSENVRI